ncbi:MAG: UDP-N-acetylenolpyruvoylglucosamine reductase [Ignavibacteria bacterium]|nr:MAG: UDP-N-acetylenolpyruvoylglucosamine reductase [Ignavibacteria bacterium]KAF0159714.1 MAG: UDP-N-acetylenolpyruvoylglucosamine reductase [Ignavibacteria bacterium]
MELKLKSLIGEKNRMNHGLQIQENYSLRNYNTFNIDVSAARFVELISDDDIKKFVSQVKVLQPIYILGGGSNVLFLNDFRGLVVSIATKRIQKIDETESSIDLECAAGETWNDVVSFCVKNNYYGIENLVLIPGTVGAAPIQNIGAYGVEIKDILINVEGFDLDSKKLLTFTNKECEFNYRSSIFKTKLNGKFLITKVRVRLSKEKKYQLNYRALNEKFGNQNIESISIQDVANYIKQIRLEKLPDHTKLGNAGSFFKNPEIDIEHLEELKKQFKGIVYFAAATGNYKIAAGWLIEECGFKGKRIGNVSCYEKQALVIVNHGGATGNEIKEYAEKIQSAVKDKFRISLIPEVNII